LFAEAQRLQALLVAPDPLAISARALQAQTLAGLGDTAAARPCRDRVRRQLVRRDGSLAAIHRRARSRAAVDALPRPRRRTRHRRLLAPHRFIVDALARDLLGDSKAVEADVERALDQAEPDARVLPFLVAPARELLERHPRHMTAHAALLSTILDVLAGSALPARRGEPLELTDELTDSEVRVLRFLPSNLSASRSRRGLPVHEHREDAHAPHLREGAHRRIEAVERARGAEPYLPGPSIWPASAGRASVERLEPQAELLADRPIGRCLLIWLGPKLKAWRAINPRPSFSDPAGVSGRRGQGLEPPAGESPSCRRLLRLPGHLAVVMPRANDALPFVVGLGPGLRLPTR
jgi:hypothetical protein